MRYALLIAIYVCALSAFAEITAYQGATLIDGTRAEAVSNAIVLVRRAHRRRGT